MNVKLIAPPPAALVYSQPPGRSTLSALCIKSAARQQPGDRMPRHSSKRPGHVRYLLRASTQLHTGILMRTLQLPQPKKPCWLNGQRGAARRPAAFLLGTAGRPPPLHCPHIFHSHADMLGTGIDYCIAISLVGMYTF